MDTAYKRTLALVQEHKDLITNMSHELLKKEVRAVSGAAPAMRCVEAQESASGTPPASLPDGLPKLEEVASRGPAEPTPFAACVNNTHGMVACWPCGAPAVSPMLETAHLTGLLSTGAEPG